jgi:hypothetical protein
MKFEFALWTREMIREVIRREFGIALRVVTRLVTPSLARKARNSLTWVFTRHGGRICALRSPSK